LYTLVPCRLVKWEDGSMQLMVGEEVFDVSEHPLANSFMFVHQKTSEGTSCLECQGRLGRKLTFKPSGLHSKAHRQVPLECSNVNMFMLKCR
jgi:Leo1-like protein